MKTNRTIDLSRISVTTAAMFDILADGEWHDAKILQREGCLALIAADFDTPLQRGKRLRRKNINEARDVDDIKFALSGGNDTARNNLMVAVRTKRLARRGALYRMTAETRRLWASAQQNRAAILPEASLKPHDPVKVRTFANMSEDVAFRSAPIQVHDRVMFRANHDIPQATFTAHLSLSWKYTYDPRTGLSRIEGPHRHGKIIAADVRDWCEQSGITPSDLRIIGKVKNRDLRDLPKAFLDELVVYYQPFLSKRMRKSMSTISKFIPDYKDQQQQMFEWVLTAIREYDERLNVPFGAFLLTRTYCRVHDMTRGSLGRTMADHQNNQSKIVARFQQDKGRDPSANEVADLMDKTPEEYAAIVASLDHASKLMAPMSLQGLYNDNQEVQVAGDEDASASVLNDSENAALAAALIGACAADKGGGVPNLVAFGHHYYKHWSGLTKGQIADTMKVTPQTVTNASERVRPALIKALKSL